MKKEMKEMLKNEVIGLNDQFKDLFKRIEASKENLNLKEIEISNKNESLRITQHYIKEHYNKQTKAFDNEYTERRKNYDFLQSKKKVLEYIQKYFDNKIENISYIIAYNLEILIDKYCENMRDFNDFDKVIEELNKNLIFRYYYNKSQHYLSVALQIGWKFYERYDYIKHYSNIFKMEWNGSKYIDIFTKLNEDCYKRLEINISDRMEKITNIELDIEKLIEEFEKIIQLNEKQHNEYEEFLKKQKEELKQKDVLNIHSFITLPY